MDTYGFPDPLYKLESASRGEATPFRCTSPFSQGTGCSQRLFGFAPQIWPQVCSAADSTIPRCVVTIWRERREVWFWAVWVAPPKMSKLKKGPSAKARWSERAVPAFTRRALARSTRSGSQLRASPTRMAVDRAMQRCPAAPKAAPTSWFRVFSLLASGITTPWFLAP